MKYQWKNNNYKINADKAGKSLELIKDKYGKITPELVVEEASNPKHILHKAFQWDDTKAAIEYRKWQARYLITSITVIIEQQPEKPEIRAFVNVKDKNITKGKRNKYITIQDAMSDPEYRKQVLNDAYEELMFWKNKYNNLRELSQVFKAIGKLKIA